MLDSTVVALALPAIERELGASPAGLQWVMNGYLLVIAVLVVTAGPARRHVRRKARLPRRHGAFAAGSVLSAAAADDEVLVAGRVVQGLGGAAMLPLSLAIVSAPSPAEQAAGARDLGRGLRAGARDRAAGSAGC